MLPGTSLAHLLIYSSNRGVRYRVEDVVLDAQAAARRGTKIGEQTWFWLLLVLIKLLTRWERCQVLPRSCHRASQALEGGRLDLAAHAGHRHLLPGHHGRLPGDGVRGGLLQPSRLDADPPPLRVPRNRPGREAVVRAGLLLVEGGAGALATCQALPPSPHTPLCPPQTQAGLPGNVNHLLLVNNLDLTSERADPSSPDWDLGHQQWPLWQPTHDPGWRHHGPNQPTCPPGPTGCLGGGEGGGGEPDDRLLLLRPHPGQPPCLLAGLTPGSAQFKPLSCSDGHLVTPNSQVAVPLIRFALSKQSYIYSMQVFSKSWILLVRTGEQCTLVNNLDKPAARLRFVQILRRQCNLVNNQENISKDEINLNWLHST